VVGLPQEGSGTVSGAEVETRVANSHGQTCVCDKQVSMGQCGVARNALEKLFNAHGYRPTYYTVDYSVFTEQDDLAWCRNQPLPLRELYATAP